VLLSTGGFIFSSGVNALTVATPALSGVNTITFANETGTVALRGANTFTALQQFTGTTHAGLRLNNLTKAERDAIASPQAGMAIWNTTAARLQLHNGSAWTAGMVRLDGDTMTGALTIATGTLATAALSLSQTWNSVGTTCRGFEVAITNTNSAAASSLLRVCGGAAGTTEFFGINANGWITGPAAGTMVITPAIGQNLNLYSQGGGSNCSMNMPVTFGEGFNIAAGTSTGSKIGTSTAQKIGFWNATPVAQQVLATGSTTDQVITLLQTLGLCRQS